MTAEVAGRRQPSTFISGPAQGRAPRPPRRVGLRAHRQRAGDPPPRDRAERPRRAAQVLRVPRLRPLHRGLPRGGRADPDARGHPLPDLRGRREMATEQGLRYAELTCTPYTSVRPDQPDAGMPIEAYTEAIEAARVEAERDFGLVLRWIYDIPGEFGVPVRRRDARLRAQPPARGAGRVRPRRPGGRRAAAAVPAALRAGPGGRAAQRARTPARPPGRRRSGTRSPCCRRSGSATAPPRPRTPRCSGTWPRRGSRSRCARRPTSRPGRWPPSRSTRSGRSATPA